MRFARYPGDDLIVMHEGIHGRIPPHERAVIEPAAPAESIPFFIDQRRRHDDEVGCRKCVAWFRGADWLGHSKQRMLSLGSRIQDPLEPTRRFRDGQQHLNAGSTGTPEKLARRCLDGGREETGNAAGAAFADKRLECIRDRRLEGSDLLRGAPSARFAHSCTKPLLLRDDCVDHDASVRRADDFAG